MPGNAGQQQTATCDSRNNWGQINISGDCARASAMRKSDLPMADNVHPLILIVDDDTAVRELLKLHLVGDGDDVRLADDAIDAGRLLRESLPELMLVDISMPYMDGIDFLRTVKAD